MRHPPATSSPPGHFALSGTKRYDNSEKNRSLRPLPSTSSTFLRPFSGALLAGVTVSAALLGFVGACSSNSASSSESFESNDGASTSLDGGHDESPVAPPAADAGADVFPTAPPSCAQYCDLVSTNCADEHAQYASKAECLSFCAAFSPGKLGSPEPTSDSVACRQYYAGSPAQTDPGKYCLSAGPFGGGVCGDRCTAFCGLALFFCAPDAGLLPYPSLPECVTDCNAFSFREGGVDGGGEGPSGPIAGDTLNCRMHELREAIGDRKRCLNLAIQSSICR